MIALRLSRLGHGRPSAILAWPLEEVLDVLEYEMFCKKYEASLYEINRVNNG